HGRHDYMWFYGIPAGKGPDGSDCGFPLSSTDLQLVTVVVDCGTIKTYVDGVLVTLACEKSEALTGTTTQSFTIPEANWGALYSDDAKMSYFGLGCSPTAEGDPDRSDTATIADVRIYDVALTTTQVKGLYDDYVNSVTTLTADVSGDVALSDIEGVADLTENDVLVLNATADATVTIEEVPNFEKIVIVTATASDEVTINISSAEAATVRSIMSKLDMSATTGIVKFTLGTYTGTAAWMAYEFNGNGDNSGSDGVALSWDDDRPLDGAEYTTADSDGNQMLHLPTRPYRDVSAYPAFCTAVMYAKAGSTANGVLASFGSSVKGSTKTITLAVGETPANGDMRLVYANGRNKGTDLVQNFKVPNSQDSYHLYAFSMYTVGGKTHIDVYVDGEKLTTYTSETAITLGEGFQIASVHGGVDNIGVVRLANDDAATMDFLRVYDCLLSEEMLKTMAEAYPYTSPSGKATRTLDGTAANWVEDADPATAWSQDILNSDATTTTTVQNAPNNGTNIVLNATAATALTINLPASTPAYETLTINGDVTLVAGEGTEKLTVSGRTTI
ncbi:MAG: hypothetical protein IJV69_07995, partial [Kiritimatiellae bacterium]|nr:hypothetical protein [Kiritimatiellia bacterium]